MRAPLLLNVTFMVPITTDNVKIDQRGIQAISMRNAGTATVNIMQGRWTLAPGETLNISVVENIDSMDFTEINVAFDTTTGAEKKLQYLLLKASPSNNC